MDLAAPKAHGATPRADVSAALADVEAELEAQLRFALGGSSQCNSELPSPSQPTGNSPRFSAAEIAAYAQLAAPIGTSSGHVHTGFVNPEGQFGPQDQIYADLADQAEADLAQDQDGADLAEDQAGAETLPTNAPTGAGATSINELGGDLTSSVWKSHATGGVADESLDISQASSVGTVVAGDNGPASTLTAPASAAATINEEQQPMPADDVLEACSAPAPQLCTTHTAPLTAPSSVSHATPSPPLPAPMPPPSRHPPASSLRQVLHSAYRNLSGTLHTLLEDGELPGRMLIQHPHLTRERNWSERSLNSEPRIEAKHWPERQASPPPPPKALDCSMHSGGSQLGGRRGRRH